MKYVLLLLVFLFNPVLGMLGLLFYLGYFGE